VGDDQRLVVFEYETAVCVAGIPCRPAEVCVRHLIRVSELIRHLGDFVSEPVRVVHANPHRERNDREHGAQPGATGAKGRRRFGVPVPHRLGLSSAAMRQLTGRPVSGSAW